MLYQAQIKIGVLFNVLSGQNTRIVCLPLFKRKSLTHCVTGPATIVEASTKRHVDKRHRDRTHTMPRCPCEPRYHKRRDFRRAEIGIGLLRLADCMLHSHC